MVYVSSNRHDPSFRPVPGVNCNEEPEIPNDRPEIDTSRLAKVFISHVDIERLLDLPDDVKITSMHTTRGEDNTGLYMICDRFDSVPEGANAPELTVNEVRSRGLWDSEGNNA